MLLVVPGQAGDHEIVRTPIRLFFPVRGLQMDAKLAQGGVQWLVIHFPFGQILAAGKGQTGRHAFEGILCAVFQDDRSLEYPCLIPQTSPVSLLVLKSFRFSISDHSLSS